MHLTDELDYFVEGAFSLVNSGYYNVRAERKREAISLSAALKERKGVPVIAEFKRRTPSQRELSITADAHGILSLFASKGICAFSVLTEPHRFDGSLENLEEASHFGLPVLMKDFVISFEQIEAARRLGADAVLLIYEIFSRYQYNLDVLLEQIHAAGMEAVLEVNSPEQFSEAMHTDAEVIGINNRDLGTLQLHRGRTEHILSLISKDRPVIGMSGVHSAADALSMIRAGADAVLIGTAAMENAGLIDSIREELLRLK